MRLSGSGSFNCRELVHARAWRREGNSAHCWPTTYVCRGKSEHGSSGCHPERLFMARAARQAGVWVRGAKEWVWVMPLVLACGSSRPPPSVCGCGFVKPGWSCAREPWVFKLGSRADPASSGRQIKPAGGGVEGDGWWGPWTPACVPRGSKPSVYVHT